MPHLLTTYANPSGPEQLAQLEAEERAITKALLPGQLAHRYLVFNENKLGRDQLTDWLRLLRKDLFLFHYGGHAEERLLQLNDQDARAEGIVPLLRRCEKLQVVVFNGCNTEAQARALHEAGIPIVIGTSCEVGDNRAMRFATAFYQELANGTSIQDAFEIAIDEANIDAGTEVMRALGAGADVVGDTAVWSILVKPETEAIYLPQEAEEAEVIDFVPNTIFTRKLFGNANLISDDLELLRANARQNPRSVSTSKRRSAIINCLPAPVGEPLRKLLCPMGEDQHGYDQLDRSRLEQIIVTYSTVMELLIYTLLAQLYQGLLRAKGKNKHILIPPELDKWIRDFIALDREKGHHYQYIYLIRQLRLFLEKQEIPFFVTELKGIAKLFADEHTDFADACGSLEALRLRLLDENLSSRIIPQLCQEGELELSEVIGHLGFMSRYTLATVKNIDIIKYSHQSQAEFMHELVRLIDVQGKVHSDPVWIEDFLDNRSVLLLQENNNDGAGVPDFLNLSPFIMDHTAFVKNGDTSVLHFFHRAELAQKRVGYQSLKTPDGALWWVKESKAPVDEYEAINPLVNDASFQLYQEAFVYEQFTTFMDLLDRAKSAAV